MITNIFLNKEQQRSALYFDFGWRAVHSPLGDFFFYKIK